MIHNLQHWLCDLGVDVEGIEEVAAPDLLSLGRVDLWSVGIGSLQAITERRHFLPTVVAHPLIDCHRHPAVEFILFRQSGESERDIGPIKEARRRFADRALIFRAEMVLNWVRDQHHIGHQQTERKTVPKIHMCRAQDLVGRSE